MFHWKRFAVLLWVVGAAAAAHGDILYLRDGSRYYGDLIQRTPSQVVFRVVTGSGSNMVRRFPAGEVAGLRETPVRVAPETLKDQRPETTGGSNDFEQMLREAFELVDDRDLGSALLALQRVVRDASADVLVRLDRQTQAARGRPLADFVADVRIQRAVADSPRKLFDLRAPTRYESAALSMRLQAMIADVMGCRFGGRPLAEWIEHPTEYTRVGIEARAIVHQARLAGAMIGARLKLDRMRNESRAQRARMARTRGQLTRLAAHVSGLPGYTELPTTGGTDDPTRAAARQILERERKRAAQAQQAPASQSASQPADGAGAQAGQETEQTTDNPLEEPESEPD
jgi:hypothetical protein